MNNLIAFFVFTLMGCSNQKETLTTIETVEEIEQTSEPEIVQAKLIRKKAYNKAGKEMPYPGDFYLVLNGEEVFVKLMSSKVTSEDLEPLLDKKSTFKIVQEDGLWDTDNPEVQSRIGKYVRILEIIE